MVRLHEISLFQTIILTIVLSASALLYKSCIDPIEFEVPSGLSESIVIQGRVVLSDPSFVEINASRLFDFSPESRQPVSIRNLVLYDSKGNQMELETRSPGRYFQELNGSTAIQAEVGTGYRISLETFDNRAYETDLDILLENKDPISLNVSLSQTTLPDNLGVFVPTDQVTLDISTNIDNSTNGGIYWEVRNVFAVTDTPVSATEPENPKTCYITKTVNVNEIYVLDPSELTSNRIDEYTLLNSLIDWRFAEGIYYEAKQYSLSPGAYAYWDAVNTLSEREGNMFDGPVGEIPTNLINRDDPNDRIFGYFFATQEKTIRVKVEQNLVGQVARLCPPPPERMCNLTPGEACTCGLCCDCLLDPESTTVRPDYWTD